MMRYVDLIVPIYRNANLVRACIDSLLENLEEIADRSPRMILVNDSPDDVPVAALLNEPALQREDVVVLANEQNLGFVKSVNRALAEALKAGRDVVLVNSDTITFPGTLRNLLNAVAQDPQIGFASPRSNNASLCSLPHSYGGVPPRPDEAFDRWQRISRSMPAWHFSPTAVGFFMYISHSVLANHGLLSEEFGPGYEEENDLVMRAGKVGRRAILVNHAFAFHAGSASFALYDLDLDSHRKGNLERMTQVHLEFLPLVKRYEGSAHFRAEQLLTGLLPELDGRSRLVFDLTGLGQHHNGTNEHAIAVVRQFVRNWSDRFRVSGIGDVQSFRFHGLDKLHGLHRVDPANPGLHAIAIRIAQPFDLHHVNVMERLAPINVYAMLDTITEDCGPLSVESEVPDLWNYVANHANGLLFNSRFAEQQFCTRHTAARLLPRMARLLSTDNRDYRTKGASKGGVGKHILVLGNHFPHKGTEPAVQRLRAAFPTLKIVAVGGRAYWDGSVTGFKSGEISADIMRTLFEEASAVVLPSHVEGFGFGLMHAIAAGKPIAARRIGATEEILAAFRSHHGIFLFDTDAAIRGFERGVHRGCGRVGGLGRRSGGNGCGTTRERRCVQPNREKDRSR
jgi:GT2 family glycosyltransferase/glycosyltransferase involved in cell wall biosynthesis